MTENRIRVKVAPEMTPVRLEDKMDLNASIDVHVDSHLTGLGVAGLVCVFLGMLAVLVGSVMFLDGYPDRWYDANDRGFVESVVLTLGGGFIALFFGMSTFFYGRTVLGSGRIDEYQAQARVEGEA